MRLIYSLLLTMATTLCSGCGVYWMGFHPGKMINHSTWDHKRVIMDVADGSTPWLRRDLELTYDLEIEFWYDVPRSMPPGYYLKLSTFYQDEKLDPPKTFLGPPSNIRNDIDLTHVEFILDDTSFELREIHPSVSGLPEFDYVTCKWYFYQLAPYQLKKISESKTVRLRAYNANYEIFEAQWDHEHRNPAEKFYKLFVSHDWAWEELSREERTKVCHDKWPRESEYPPAP
ncbi:hypothetical protein JD969_07235 [Planctomycetota bacterium]|nr:hypothetical protein JD969_07235 [Planctomycetota bacterium]